ncbi:DUF5988 family protein [Streptomyces sp. CAS3]
MTVFAEPAEDIAFAHSRQQLVLLEGASHGPEGLMRLTHGTATLSDRVTVAYYGRHQHFARTQETRTVSGLEVPLYRWTYSTAIAE